MTPSQWSVLSRSLAAALGGYALSSTLSVAVVASAFGPMARADAVLAAMSLSFLVYTGAVMWAFAARSAGRAWRVLGALVLLSGAIAWTAL